MNFSVGIALLAFSTASYAAEGGYKYHECKNEQDAYSCGKSCVLTKVTLDIKVNVNNNIVQVSAFEDGKLLTTHSPENCKVVDTKNWTCGYGYTSDKYGSYNNITAMNDGLFISINEAQSKLTGVSKLYNCAKRSGVLKHFGF